MNLYRFLNIVLNIVVTICFVVLFFSSIIKERDELMPSFSVRILLFIAIIFLQIIMAFLSYKSNISSIQLRSEKYRIKEENFSYLNYLKVVQPFLFLIFMPIYETVFYLSSLGLIDVLIDNYYFFKKVSFIYVDKDSIVIVSKEKEKIPFNQVEDVDFLQSSIVLKTWWKNRELFFEQEEDLIRFKREFHKLNNSIIKYS